MKTIIVCAPEKYSKIARRLTHILSKKAGIDTTYWSTNKYRDNESSLSSSQQYVIFIGNKSENNFVDDYIELIENINDESGACYGYDANKAIIFGTGNLEQMKEFFEKWRKQPFLQLIYPYFQLFRIPYLVDNFYSDSKKKEKLVHDQTKMACFNFLEKGFEEWIDLKGEGL
jgi:hypothetical protein